MRTIITKTGRQSLFGLSDLARAIKRSTATVWLMCYRRGKIPPPTIKSEGGRLYWAEHEFRGLVAAILEEQASRTQAVKT